MQNHDVIWSQNSELYPQYLRSRINRGQGVGKGIEYRSWLKIREVPSKGSSAAVMGILVRRRFELLSQLETIFFFLTERRPDVVDIRENWPILDLARTVELCAKLGVRHSSKGLYPFPFTIDFLITEKAVGGLRHVGASIKTPRDARNQLVCKRLNIEYQWCRENGIDWALIDTSGFTDTLLSTLRFMRRWFRNRYEPTESRVACFLEYFSRAYQRNVVLGAILEKISARMRLDLNEVENLFTYSAWKGSIPICVEQELRLDRPTALK